MFSGHSAGEKIRFKPLHKKYNPKHKKYNGSRPLHTFFPKRTLNVLRVISILKYWGMFKHSFNGGKKRTARILPTGAFAWLVPSALMEDLESSGMLAIN